MNNFSLGDTDWVAHGWLLILAFTASTLLVGAIRKPCRYFFGTERAVQLWLLIPLAMMASQVPHVEHAIASPLPPMMLTVTTVATTLADSTYSESAIRWQAVILILWLLGVTAGILRVATAQWHYQRRLRNAEPAGLFNGRWPIWRAVSADIGPALVGAWRPRIVIPADFEKRYDITERSLILLHEAIHAERRDGWWSLSAHMLLVMCWFHPLAWWAFRAFRLDQELACDAAVLRSPGSARARYAQAMLKTQSVSFALPAGCSWPPRHPITERIAMLKQLSPGRLGRSAGFLVLWGLGVFVAVGVYAASASPNNTKADRYQLKVELGVNGQPARLHARMCLKLGQYYDVLESGLEPMPAWRARFAVVPAPGRQLEVQAEISGGSSDHPASPRLRMLPGQAGTIEIGKAVENKDGRIVKDERLRVELTPSVGC